MHEERASAQVFEPVLPRPQPRSAVAAAIAVRISVVIDIILFFGMRYRNVARRKVHVPQRSEIKHAVFTAQIRGAVGQVAVFEQFVRYIHGDERVCVDIFSYFGLVARNNGAFGGVEHGGDV